MFSVSASIFMRHYIYKIILLSSECLNYTRVCSHADTPSAARSFAPGHNLGGV